MNRIYRKVWNKALGQMVVASELASSQSSGVVIDRSPGYIRAYAARRIPVDGASISEAQVMASATIGSIVLNVQY